jgi:hypothetical protein
MATPQPDGTAPPQQGMPPPGSVYPPYQPLYPYPIYAPMPMRPQLPASSRAIWSMVLGIVGIVIGFFIGFIFLLLPGATLTSSGSSSIFEYVTVADVVSIAVPLAISVVAVVLGHTSLAQIRQGMVGGQGYAIAGLVLGYVGIGFRVLGIVVDIVLFTFVYSHLTF